MQEAEQLQHMPSALLCKLINFGCKVCMKSCTVTGKRQDAKGPHVQGMALRAGCVAAQGLLPALVTCHALHLVVDAVAIWVVPVLEQLPV